jgi:hypothetical protein
MAEEGKILFMKSTENDGEQVGICLNAISGYASSIGEGEEIFL